MLCIHPHRVTYHLTLCWDDMSSGKKEYRNKKGTFEKWVLDAEAIVISKRCTWLCSAPAGDICSALTPLTFEELKHPVYHAPMAVLMPGARVTCCTAPGKPLDGLVLSQSVSL